MPTQADKGKLFRELHERHDAFIIPNPWDAGTARILAHLGFEALATTSAGFAFSQGQQDNTVGRQQVLEHIATIVSASDLPVSADLEKGFGDSPEIVAETIRLAAAAGAVGGSIEDATGDPANPIYDFDCAVERVQAAARAARDLPFTFTLTARAENYMQNRRNLQDTIRRLQAYEEMGADVLYAPGLSSAEEINAVVHSLNRPLNVLMGLPGVDLDLATLSKMRVKRISVGSALFRAALGAFLRGAREMREAGTFRFVDEAANSREISEMLKP